MPEPHDWPIERPAKGSLRPWFFSAEGYLGVLFKDGEEAQRARRGLLERGVPDEDMRLYGSEQVLSIESRLQEGRSSLAKAIAALTADRTARERYLANARAGGAALWLFAPTHDRADGSSACWPTTGMPRCATTARTGWKSSAGMPTDTTDMLQVAIAER